MQLFTQQRPKTDFKHVKNPKDDFIESDFKSCKKYDCFTARLFYSEMNERLHYCKVKVISKSIICPTIHFLSIDRITFRQQKCLKCSKTQSFYGDFSLNRIKSTLLEI